MKCADCKKEVPDTETFGVGEGSNKRRVCRDCLHANMVSRQKSMVVSDAIASGYNIHER